MPMVVARVPGVKLVIIGHGPYEARIKEIINERKLESSVSLYGPMNHERILSVLPSFALGLAPYSPSPNSITWYADPTKIKDYLTCGLPVVVTNVPEVASELEKRGAGTIIQYSAGDLAQAVIRLMSPQHLERFQKNAYAMAAEYDWNALFVRAIERSSKDWPQGF